MSVNANPQRILVVICTFNEIENLPALIERIGKGLPQAEMLVVDDNSPDGTGQWCMEKRTTLAGLHVIIRSGKLGLGSAAIAGLRFGMENRFDLIATLDADFSHDPAQLGSLVAALDDPQFDVAIGSRYVPEGKIVGWPWHRRLMSRWLNRTARLALALPVKDCSGAFRCYRASALAKLDFDQIRSSGYAYLEEILWWLKQTGAKMVEIPITFRDRELGETKISSREAVGALLTICRIGLKNYCRRKRPEPSKD